MRRNHGREASVIGARLSQRNDATLVARLSPLALTHWPTVARQIGGTGLLNSVDISSLVRYCEAFARWCAIGEELAGMLIELGTSSRQPIQTTVDDLPKPPPSMVAATDNTRRQLGRTADAIIRLADVKAETGLSRSTIYQRIKAGTFPPQIKLGERSVGWRVADIEMFLSSPATYKASIDSTKGPT